MTIKKEYIILAVIIISLSAYLILKSTDRTHYELPGIPAIGRETIDKIVFSSGGDTVTLERRDDTWIISPREYPADGNAVGRMLDAVGGFALTSLVSESGNYAVYDLGGEKRIELDVYSDTGEFLSIGIGKTASTYRHTYVQLEGEGGIYQAEGNLRTPFELDVSKLRDRVVMKFDRESVTAIGLEGSKGSLKFARTVSAPVGMPGQEGAAAPAQPVSLWQTADGKEAESKKIDQIVQALSSLRCDDFIEGRTTGDFTGPVYTLTVSAPEEITLFIYEPEDEKYPAVSSQNDYPFFLPKWRAEQLMKDPSELVAGREEQGEEGTE